MTRLPGPDQPHAEWRGRADFHEVAEAVGTTTDLIMAYHPYSGSVLFSREAEPELLYSATVRRDDQGVMHATDVRPRPGLWEKIKADAERELGKRFRRRPNG